MYDKKTELRPLITTHLVLLRSNAVGACVPRCPICTARLFNGDQVGYLVGITKPVCASCWWYFQMP